MSSEALSNTPHSLEQEQAKQRVDRFVRRFQPSYRLLAYYAALPLVLTPDLLHYLRVRFLRGSGVPWVGEVDLLLSELCRPVGYEQYAMDTAVRAALYEEMEQELGQPKIVKAAQLLVRYVTQMAQANPYLSEQELRSQQWGAIAYIDPERVVRQIATAYQQVATGSNSTGLSRDNRTELASLSLITQELAPQLKHYPKLLEYAAVVGQSLVDPEQVPLTEVQPVYQVLDGVDLRLPAGLLPTVQPRNQVDGQPVIRKFAFEVATIVFDDDPAPPEALPSQSILPHQFQPFEFQIATVDVGTQISAERRQLTSATQDDVNLHPSDGLSPGVQKDLLNDEQAVNFTTGGINAEEALRWVEELLLQQGHQLTDLQRLVFLGSWDGKGYEAIHQDCGFRCSLDHLKRNVGYQLWKLLSEVFGQKVLKNTLQGRVLQAWQQRNTSQHLNIRW